MTRARLLDNNSVIFIMGPTASGKTDIAMELAQKYPVEIINADAAQVYKQMNIGTAKPSAQELLNAPHRLIDFVDPVDSYSAAAFRADALAEIKQIHSQEKTPVLVGGSMFYFKALEHGLSILPQANESIRRQIEGQADIIGWPKMHQRLEEIDPLIAAKIKSTDSQRIQRALEIFELTGKTPTCVFQSNTEKPMPYKAIKLVIAPYERKVLHQRIEQRFIQMLECGLIQEVEQLRQRNDLSIDLPSMKTVGYRQVWEYLDGTIDKTTMIDKAVAATRQLAKRQLTWLRNQPGVVWLVGYNDSRGVGLNLLHQYFAY